MSVNIIMNIVIISFDKCNLTMVCIFLSIFVSTKVMLKVAFAHSVFVVFLDFYILVSHYF